ncbi:MAG: hypothetical protein L0Y71_20785 [Gemmataceae bacterium]|nr:hypothetical protein [Gemmataceae bacterium]
MDSPSQSGSSRASGPARRGDAGRAVLLVLFAFLAASFPATNADVWQRLATGRALFDGSYSFGVDPFAYTTANAYWVNHGWLFDALAFGLHQALGGMALVVVKALLIALAAAVTLRLCWRGSQVWVATLPLAVSLVALSPYALLRPVCVSMLLLSFTYAWLERHPAPASWREVVPLLLVFVLWPNLDEWFLLGPLMVMLWWLGGLVQARTQGNVVPSAVPSERRISLAWVAVAGLGLALVNPHHIRVFTIPQTLDPTIERDWLDAAWDRHALTSPLEWLASDASLVQPPRWAYAGLVVAGVVSFVLRRDGLPMGRLLIWALLFGLSLYRTGAIPFFATVAGPIAALNLHEWYERRAVSDAASARSTRAATLVRWASVPLLAFAAVAAWTGWIRAFPGEPRRWDLVLDPALAAAARQLADWHSEGKVAAEARGLPTSSAAACVLAWLCPAEKSFCDDRPHLFAPAVRADFAALRRSLFGAGDKEAAAAWRTLLAKYAITHVLVDRADERGLSTGLGRLFSSPAWTIQHLHGGATVLARPSPPIRAPAVDLWARTYRPASSERAPPNGPARAPRPRSWLDAFDTPAPADDPGRVECVAWQAHFDAQRSLYLRRMRADWDFGLAGSIVGLAAADPGPVSPGSVLRWTCLASSQASHQADRNAPLYGMALQVFDTFVGLRDDGPPGSLHAAIRAARRALLANPDEARTHLYLGEAYLRLRRHTRERALAPAFVPLDHLRRIQTLAALRHAARLDPDLAPAHERLAVLYHEIGYVDLSLEQVRALIQTLKAHPRNDRTETAAQRLEHWENLEPQLARQVRDAQLALRAQELDVYGKARGALRHGLAAQALATLETDVASIGRDGMRLKLDLMLHTGQTRAARELLDALLEAPGDQSDFRWLHVYLSAAGGDYAAADRDLAKLSERGEAERGEAGAGLNVAIATILSRYLLDSAARLPIRYPFDLLLQRDEFIQVVRFSEIAALRGVLALEAGDIDCAGQKLRRSLQWFEAGPAGRLARGCLDLIEMR